ncbi:putative Adenosine deaminase [Paratrimastix pyriformis]|uniref:adenosine deaminase n=1 Tax=Paratrimastix pyriformis TaxID=342808 RepID=A0ABQ8UL16_9EUKA|nr:putative Adenosine deaminase [Paratrimastix pyriformis]
MASLPTRVPQSKRLTLDIIKRMPKAELHCHLDGSVRISTIIEMAKEQHITLPTFDPVELRKLVTVGEDCPSLVEYLRGFDITLSVLQKPYALVRTVYEICEDAVADGVRYVEIRFSPILHTRENLNLSTIMHAISEGKAMAEYNLPVCVRIIVCGMRQMDAQFSKNMAEIAWRYRDQGVVGFDLAGPEEGFSSKNHREAFDIVRSNCLNCTLHSGEAAGWESIQDSIRFCGAHRIGHGVRLIENRELLNFVVDRRIALECCITSNVQTKAVQALSQHPIRAFYDRRAVVRAIPLTSPSPPVSPGPPVLLSLGRTSGVVVVPCTDNVTVSGVTLSEEYLKLHEKFDFSPEELVRMIDYGFESAFLDASTRRRFRAEAMEVAMPPCTAPPRAISASGCGCLRVLTEEGFDVSGLVDAIEFQDGLGVGYVAEAPTYWAGHENPCITSDVLRALPKCDLHIRFVGSMSLEAVWSELKRTREALALVPDCQSFQDFRAKMLPEKHTPESTLFSKRIFGTVLQTKQQLENGIEDIYRKSSEDGVVYLELMVRLADHTLKGLSNEEVLNIVLGAKDRLESELPIKSGLVLFVHNPEDDPIAYREIAELAVRYRDQGVVAFGVFGDDLNKEDYRFFASTFHYLKEHNVHVTISAGRYTPDSMLTALHEGGATRICGGYCIHKTPTVVNYIANHNYPVELSCTEHLRQHTAHVRSFAGNVVRLLLDNDIRVVICSFGKSQERMSLSEMLFSLVDDCHLSMAEVLIILANGYRSSFQPHNIRETMFAGFWTKAKQYLRSRGFECLCKKHYWDQTKLPHFVHALPAAPAPVVLSAPMAAAPAVASAVPASAQPEAAPAPSTVVMSATPPPAGTPQTAHAGPDVAASPQPKSWDDGM